MFGMSFFSCVLGCSSKNCAVMMEFLGLMPICDNGINGILWDFRSL